MIELSLNSNVFSSLRNDFNSVLEKVLTNMKEQKNDTAEITVKVKINMEESFVPTDINDFSHRTALKPVFQHKVSSVLQVKDEKSGGFGGDYEMIWDVVTKKYVLVEINTNQLSLFQKQQEET